jgi:hypothetical protein
MHVGPKLTGRLGYLGFQTTTCRPFIMTKHYLRVTSAL